MTVSQIAIIVASMVVAQGIFVFIQWRFLWFPLIHRYDDRYSRVYYPYYEPALMEIIESAQREARVELTWGARQMLMIPVIETIQRQGTVDVVEIRESIRDIVRTIGEEERRPELPARTRDSVSVIKGFWRRFCNIPPFCSRTEEVQR